MTEKDNELQTDFKFAKKYIKDDSSNNSNELNNKSIFADHKSNINSNSSIEILGSIGQEEGYSENKGYKDTEEDSIDILADKHSEKIEFEDKARVKAIIEQDKNIDNESINLDTINKINHNSKRK